MKEALLEMNIMRDNIIPNMILWLKRGGISTHVMGPWERALVWVASID